MRTNLSLTGRDYIDLTVLRELHAAYNHCAREVRKVDWNAVEKAMVQARRSTRRDMDLVTAAVRTYRKIEPAALKARRVAEGLLAR